MTLPTDTALVAAFDRTMATLKTVGLVLGVGVALMLSVATIGAVVYVGGWVGGFYLFGLGVLFNLTLEQRSGRIRVRNASRMLLPRWARSPRRMFVPHPAPRD
jgi:hypothetical protein